MTDKKRKRLVLGELIRFVIESKVSVALCLFVGVNTESVAKRGDILRVGVNT